MIYPPAVINYKYIYILQYPPRSVIINLHILVGLLLQQIYKLPILGRGSTTRPPRRHHAEPVQNERRLT